LPAGATIVHNAAELTAALGGSAKDIVLADGDYTASSPFSDTNGSRLYAQNLGKAVLRAGLVMGGNFGSPTTLVRGVVFDVSQASQVLGGGIVHVWGPGGANAQILDCVFRGNWTIPYGLFALNPSGLVVKRSQFYSFTDVGVRLSNNSEVPYGGSTPVIDSVEDITIDGVSRAVPGASNGTAEAGLWIGHPVKNGVHRIKIRNVSWSGIETANNAWDTQFTDLDIDMGGAHQAQGVGIYMEHYSYKLNFSQFSITGAKIGIKAEWADPAWGGKAAAHNVAISNGVIDSDGTTLAGNQAGVYLDEGTESTAVTGVTFRNQNWAGIGAYKTVGSNAFSGNAFQMKSGAVQVSPNHY
jgi:hypothetical protein